MEEIKCFLDGNEKSKEDIQKIFDEYFNMREDGNSTKYKQEYDELQLKKMFVCDEVFNWSTYDDDLSIDFGEIFIQVCQVINSNLWIEYIKDKSRYKLFIMVANQLDKLGAIEWGTSIRSCWFQFSDDSKWTDFLVQWICDIK